MLIGGTTSPDRPAPPEPPRRREGLLVAVAAVLGALSVLATLLAVQRWATAPTGIDAAAPPVEDAAAATDASAGPVPDRSSGRADPTPSTAPPTTGAPEADPPAAAPGTPPRTPPGAPPDAEVEPLACPAGVLPAICEAAEFVQQARGRPFRRFPEVEILADDAFDAELGRDLEEYRGELDEDDLVLTALGLLDDELDLFTIYETFLEVGVVGFYRTDTGRLVVRGSDGGGGAGPGDGLDLYERLVLVHELVHALDDQWFELDRDLANDDADYAFSAVVEGNAGRVENEWRARLSPGEQAELARQELGAVPVEDLQRLLTTPQIVLDLQLSPYVDGEVFVDQLVAAGDEQAVDDALTDPPPSSEQILHPEARLRPEGRPVPVGVPPTEGPVTGDGVLGELLVRHWLGPAAAAGWGGDAYALWEIDGTTCITVDLVADTATDLAEIEDAARRWAADRPGAGVDTIDGAEPATVRVSGCP